MLAYLKKLHSDSLFRNSFYLMLATAAMAGFGFFFWLITAHLFITVDIGLATTLISVMSLIAILSLVGVNSAFVRFLPASADKNDSMNTGLILVSIASVLLSVLFILFVRHISPQLIFIRENLSYSLAFIFACVMTSLNILTDSIFLANRQTKFTLVIDIIFSIFKMLTPLAFIGWGAMGIFIGAGLAQTLGTVLSLAAMARWFGYRPELTIKKEVVAMTWRYSAGNYFAGILNLMPVTVLPIIIINHLGAAPAAYYYIALMVANLLYAIPYSTTRSLFAESSHDEKSLSTHLGKSVQTIALFLLPSMLILYLGAGELLQFFGKAYTAGGIEFLRILILAAIAVSIYSVCNSLFQVKKGITAIIIVNAVYATSIIGLSYAFLPWGLTGIGIAWTTGNLIGGLVGIALHRLGPDRVSFAG